MSRRAGFAESEGSRVDSCRNRKGFPPLVLPRWPPLPVISADRPPAYFQPAFFSHSFISFGWVFSHWLIDFDSSEDILLFMHSQYL